MRRRDIEQARAYRADRKGQPEYHVIAYALEFWRFFGQFVHKALERRRAEQQRAHGGEEHERRDEHKALEHLFINPRLVHIRHIGLQIESDVEEFERACERVHVVRLERVQGMFVVEHHHGIIFRGTVDLTDNGFVHRFLPVVF